MTPQTEDTGAKAPIEKRKFLTAEEVCERWGNALNPRTLANWRSSGTGPEFTKLGGCIMYPVDKLEKWEQQNTVQSTSQYRGNSAKESRK